MKNLSDYLNDSMSEEYKDIDYLGEHLFDEFLFKNGFTINKSRKIQHL